MQKVTTQTDRCLSCTPLPRYYEATSEWTLDYPPLFAWFEWAMAKVARYFDPKMLVVSNLEYDSDATVLFQRLSVCVTGLVLVAAMLHATKASKDSVQGLTAFFLAVANAGLIMVDNIHFQYNSILLGEWSSNSSQGSNRSSMMQCSKQVQQCHYQHQQQQLTTCWRPCPAPGAFSHMLGLCCQVY